MSTTVIEYPGYEAICPWHHRQPFDGVEQYPTVITRADAPYQSWSPAPGNSTPSWMYVGTKRVNAARSTSSPAAGSIRATTRTRSRTTSSGERSTSRTPTPPT